MADTEKNSETATQGDSQTTVTTTSTQDNNQGNQVDTAEVERLRKEAEQAKMRANQLEKEKAEREKRDAEAEAEKLAEQNKWKEIAEQNKAKVEAFEKEREEAVAKAELEKTQEDVYKEFPQDVVELAKETGLELNENSEEAKEALKTKLNKLSEKISSDGKPTANNQRDNNNQPSRDELMKQHAEAQNKTPGSTSQAYDEAVGNLNWIKHSKAINHEE